MIIKVKKNWKDLVDSGAGHKILSRREFLAQGAAASAMAITLPHMLTRNLVKGAMGAGFTKGAIGTSFASGGPTAGARILGNAQASAVASNTQMANNYGILGTDMVNLGPNFNVSQSSPFGAALLAGPNGYTGGSAAWLTNVLKKCSAGMHIGPFSQDDGAGVNTGLWGTVSPMKTSQVGKDLVIGNQGTIAGFANGLPSDTIKTGGGNNTNNVDSSLGLTSTNLATVFSLTPATAGFATSATIASSGVAAGQIAAAFSSIFGTNTRRGGAAMQTAAQTAMGNNTPMASPDYGLDLFTPPDIPGLTTQGLTAAGIASMTPQEQALLASYYQSAEGLVGGIVTQWGGRDYHGTSVQNTIAPADIEEARALVMFLAACEAAQQPGAFIHFSNGQAIASGTQSVTANIGGANVTVNGPVAQGDAGGAYNASTIVFYSPTGAPPQTSVIGTLTTTNGNAKSGISSQLAVAGQYLSALAFINGGTIPQAALTQMASTIGTTPTSSIMVIS